MRPLVWFRSDLRTADNAALRAATESATRGIVAVFVICTRQWKDEHDWGGNKADFLLRTLADLSDRLKNKNIGLLIRECPKFDGVTKVLRQVAKEQDCDALYFNDEYEWNERQRDAAVIDAFTQVKIKVHRFTDQVVLEPGSVRTGEGKFYTVFSPFKRRWYAAYEELGGMNAGGVGAPHPDPKKQDTLVCDPDDVPSQIKGLKPDIDPKHWPAGEAEAKRRLTRFTKHHIMDYKDARDTPSVDGTSTMSPYLAVGAISPRQCVAASIEANDGKVGTGRVGPVGWCDELVWREFYKHILIGFPRVSRGRNFRTQYDDIDWSQSTKNFEAWQAGKTGYPIIDAGMRQLREIGWMHNRLRMIVAMFLTKDLFLPWWWGERHFMNLLVDGDLASNNGGWQWSASTGTDAQPYFRIFNPISQSQRFDPEGEYIRRWVPELRSLDAKKIHDPGKWSDGLFDKVDYPEMIVDHAKARERTLEAFKAVK